MQMITTTNNVRLSKQRTPFCKLTLRQHLSTLQQRLRPTTSPIRYTLFAYVQRVQKFASTYSTTPFLRKYADETVRRSYSYRRLRSAEKQ